MRSPAPYARRYDLLVAYDVDTTSREGRRRLRRVAKICEGFGQRVQFSVFECRVTEEQMEDFQHSLTETMDARQDSLRMYRLHGGREGFLFTYGRDTYRDFEDPLII